MRDMPFCGGARCIDWGGHDNVPCQVMCIIMVSDHLFWHMSGSSVCCTCADYPVALCVFCSSATLCLVRSSWALVLLRGCLSPSGVSLRALCVLSTECYVQCVACRVRYGMRFFVCVLDRFCTWVAWGAAVLAWAPGAALISRLRLTRVVLAACGCARSGGPNVEADWSLACFIASLPPRTAHCAAGACGEAQGCVATNWARNTSWTRLSR